MKQEIRKKVGNWKMQEIRISRNSEKVENHKKSRKSKKSKKLEKRKSEKFGKITQPLRTIKNQGTTWDTPKTRNLLGLNKKKNT